MMFTVVTNSFWYTVSRVILMLSCMVGGGGLGVDYFLVSIVEDMRFLISLQDFEILKLLVLFLLFPL